MAFSPLSALNNLWVFNYFSGSSDICFYAFSSSMPTMFYSIFFEMGTCSSKGFDVVMYKLGLPCNRTWLCHAPGRLGQRIRLFHLWWSFEALSHHTVVLVLRFALHSCFSFSIDFLFSVLDCSRLMDSGELTNYPCLRQFVCRYGRKKKKKLGALCVASYYDRKNKTELLSTQTTCHHLRWVTDLIFCAVPRIADIRF